MSTQQRSPLEAERLREAFCSAFGRTGKDVRFVRSPLRVCPLGAHVDHQLGLVSGFALDKAVWAAFAPREDRTVRARSLTYKGEIIFSLDDIPGRKSDDWGNYLRGAAQALREAYEMELRRGVDLLVSGSLPTGGLGSSAAVGIAYLLALEAANDLSVSREKNIRLDQQIENQYLGLRNGILDQSMTLLCQKAELLFLDCRDASHESIPGPAPDTYRILIAYSGYSDALVGTDYNRRVGECQEAAAMLLEEAGQPNRENVVLRDVAPELFEEFCHRLPAPLAKRARHFFTEIQRVQNGIEAWRRADLETFGRLIRESGKSSIENYECGRRELIMLYNILNGTPGVFGARFSGAGFRGSSLALVRTDEAENARELILERYRVACPEVKDRCEVFICETDNGAEVL